MATSSRKSTPGERTEGPRFERLSKDIRYETVKNQLLSAMDSKRTNYLEVALNKYKECLQEERENDKLLKEAEHELNYLKLRDALRDAMEREDLEALETFCERAESNELNDYKNPLFPDLIDARQMIIMLNRRRNAKVPATLQFDNTVMREMARIVRPPAIVHDVVIAALLLLHEYEGHTRDWNYCKEVLKPYNQASGKGGLRWRIENFNASTVSNELAARAREILDQYTLPQVNKTSRGCASFYVWAKTQLQDIKEAKPADLKRQREIIGLEPQVEHWSAPHYH